MVTQHTQEDERFEATAHGLFASYQGLIVSEPTEAIPAMLFLHRPLTEVDVEVSTHPLTARNAEEWQENIAQEVKRSRAEWWAVALEMRLRVDEREHEAGLAANTDHTHWLVVGVADDHNCSAWWAQIERNEDAMVVFIDEEAVIPKSPVRQQVLRLVRLAQRAKHD